MKAKIYSHDILVGSTKLRVTDESKGVVSGVFLPSEAYPTLQKTADRELNALRLNAQLENGFFLFPINGFLIKDRKDLPDEPKELEAVGVSGQIIEDFFLTTSTNKMLSYPWEPISLKQKLAFEDELRKEIGSFEKPGALRFFKKKHQLAAYEFSAQAVAAGSDDVLFAVHKKAENSFKYAVIHLTWKGRPEENDNFPRTEFYQTFAEVTENE